MKIFDKINRVTLPILTSERNNVYKHGSEKQALNMIMRSYRFDNSIENIEILDSEIVWNTKWLLDTEDNEAIKILKEKLDTVKSNIKIEWLIHKQIKSFKNVNINSLSKRDAVNYCINAAYLLKRRYYLFKNLHQIKLGKIKRIKRVKSDVISNLLSSIKKNEFTIKDIYSARLNKLIAKYKRYNERNLFLRISSADHLFDKKYKKLRPRIYNYYLQSRNSKTCRKTARFLKPKRRKKITNKYPIQDHKLCSGLENVKFVIDMFNKIDIQSAFYVLRKYLGLQFIVETYLDEYHGIQNLLTRIDEAMT